MVKGFTGFNGQVVDNVPGPSKPASPPIRPPSASSTGQKRGLEDEERQQAEREALAALAKLGYHATPADLGKLHPPDIYEEELEVMAEVRAYWRVAYKVRFVLFPSGPTL